MLSSQCTLAQLLADIPSSGLIGASPTSSICSLLGDIGVGMAPITAKTRVALNTMKAIGIPMQTAKPVLMNLLKVYDNHWEYIEAENYRLLADAILDMQESKSKDMGGMGKNGVARNEPEPLKKRTRNRKGANDPGPAVISSDTAAEFSLKRPKLEEDVRSEAYPVTIRDELANSMDHKGKIVETSLPEVRPMLVYTKNSRRKTVESELPEINHRKDQAVYLRNRKGKKVAETSSQPTFGEAPEKLSMPPCSKKQRTTETLLPQLHDSFRRTGQASSPMNSRVTRSQKQGFETCSGPDQIGNFSSVPVRPKDEPRDDDLPLCDTPIAVMPPPQSISFHVGEVSHQHSLKNPILQKIVVLDGTHNEQNEKDKENLPDNTCNKGSPSKILSVQDSSSVNVNAGSSDLGEVKLSFWYNFDRPSFHVPNLEDVYKLVEDKCLRSYKILQPSFSIKNLMNEMCQCFVELSSEITDNEQENFVQINSLLDSLKKPVMASVCIPASSDGFLGSTLSGGFQDRSGPSHCHNDAENNQNGTSKKRKKPEFSESAKDTSQGLVMVQQPQYRLAEFRPLHDVDDISKGEERVRIPVVNEITTDKYPPSFNYIPQNFVYQSAYLNFSLARIGDEDCCADCFNDCLAAPIPCACARETAGDFAYTTKGVVKRDFLDESISMYREPEKHHKFYCPDCPLERSKNEISPEPCRGHLIRKFIKECWRKCGCSMHCGNRVVQRGITCNLQVFRTSEGKGWGLRTLDELPRGAFVCEYVGEVLTNMELYDRTVQKTGNAKHTYPVLLDADWGSEGRLKDEEALCLDATFYGNVARFINHRCCDANLIEIPVEIETPDHHYYHLAYFTTRRVEPLEELTWDYGIDFDDDDHPIKAFKCRCGSRLCRDIKR
ncbi:probable inactive histone-lysine N-methyltransferase SUVR2 isoform X1 [Zingiber officinale]|uniref:probable inactive histone-lysine N-methyltransferase SUVR2 isoform X1 n=2 Tax=Zingiber officinale TaxID=94328 RepID=UPI001C4B7986|nr:probable inactive histone-lysine N-methyltransferase SUVR2 isoform X1 [Zingiber officinale]